MHGGTNYALRMRWRLAGRVCAYAHGRFNRENSINVTASDKVLLYGSDLVRSRSCYARKA